MPTIAEILRHPAPDLNVHPTSGLDFPWAEYHPDGATGSSSHTFGPDGVTVAMRMLIYWDTLPYAVQQLLGYSYRDAGTLTPRGTPWLRRKLPWKHPFLNQLYVKRISEVRGIRQQGKVFQSVMFGGRGGGQAEMRTGMPVSPGVPYRPNLGPWTDFFLAELTIHFWRPPYYVRTDAAVLDVNGSPQEWLRYTSKNWEMQLSMLSRENATFQWLPGVKPPSSSTYFTGSVGQPVTHLRVNRTWYQIPEQAIFRSIGSSGMPDGIPKNFVYTQTAVENPLSKYDRALGSTQTTYPTTVTTTIGTTVTMTVTSSTRTTIGTTTPNASQLLAALGYVYPQESPLGGCVNAPISPTGGTGRTVFAVDGAGNWTDNTTAARIFGCYTGTLRYDGVTITPQPLQLPPELMLIPRLQTSMVESLSQQQYDVTFHFDLFEPPPGPLYGTPIRGHNLFPFAGNAQWYPLLSQKDISNLTSGPKLTPHNYADFSDLFFIL